ncbi:putative plant PDR ABC transporter associated [Helianthus annuus]|nr:putative plant PDR ABC transporter associated [Helianthus annuus]
MKSSDNSTNLGFAVLNNLDIQTTESSYWIGAGALLGFIFLFNILFTVALMYVEVTSLWKTKVAAMDGHFTT